MSGVSAYVTKLAISVTEDFWCIVTPRRVKTSKKSAGPPARVPAEKLVRDIRRATRKHHSAEDKIRIVLEGLRGEESIAALCRREAIAESLYYAWSKEFLGEALARHGFKRHAER
jgi:hypothetical protein